MPFESSTSDMIGYQLQVSLLTRMFVRLWVDRSATVVQQMVWQNDMRGGGVRVLCGLAIALICVLAASTLLFALQAEHYFRKNRVSAIDPVHRGVYSDANSRISEFDGLVMYGDSRIIGWRDRPPKIMGGVVHRGIGGETTAQSLGRVEQDVISLGPSRVIIQLGINDVIAAALDTDRAEHILSVAVRNTLLLIRLILDDDIAVIYSTIMPVSNLSVAERLLYKRDLNADVNEINRLILDQIPKEVIVLDAAGIIGETNAVRYKDSLHLTSDSYEVLNRALRKLLKDN